MASQDTKFVQKDDRKIEIVTAFAGCLVWLNSDGTAMHISENFSQEYLKNAKRIPTSNWIKIDQSFDKITFKDLWNRLCDVGKLDWETNLLINGTSNKVRVEARILQTDLCLQACLRISKIEDVNTKSSLISVLDNSANSSAWSWNFQTGEFAVTDFFYELLDLERDENTSMAVNITSILQPLISTEKSTQLKDAILQSKRKEIPFELTWEKKEKSFILRGYPLFEVDKVIGVKGDLRSTDHTIGDEMIYALLYTAMNKSLNTILILDENYFIKYYNPAASLKLGYNQDEIKHGIQITNIDIEQDLSIWQQIKKDLQAQGAKTITTSFQRKNSKVFPVKATLCLHKELDKNYIYVNAEDISSMRISESQLNATLAHKELTSRRLEEERTYLISESNKDYEFENIVSVSENYIPVLKQIKQVANTDSTVLIEGETGTGKELLARAIHNSSYRADHPLIVVNCGSLPSELIESELFGHEKGAFTGAYKQKKGKFEVADKSTILLDEIGELPLDLQARLLRVLQEGEIQRLGSEKTLKIDTRIIAATNRNLSEMVESGAFRMDLFYRLNVFPIYNLPLRERHEDIKVLAHHFLKKYSKKMKKFIDKIASVDMDRLLNYDFPGNIRELENIIERSVILTQGKILNLDFWVPKSDKNRQIDNELATLEEIQKQHIMYVLQRTKWRISGKEGAAKILGMKDQTLFSKMRKLDIKRT